MNVLILHGIFGNAGENWGQWLSDELTARSYKVTMPTLPKADHPDRDEWLAVIRDYAAGETEELIIVAHSLGVTSALDFIEESITPIKALICVSGMAQDYGFEPNGYFLKVKDIDFPRVNHLLENAFVFYGDNDPYVTQDALRSLAANLHAVPVIIKDGGHLNAAAGFTEFPQLLATVLSV
jgi:hypothetical protein